MNAKLAFLQSRRFWCAVVIAILGVFKAEGIVSPEIVNAFITVLVSFIGIRTIDRFGENKAK